MVNDPANRCGIVHEVVRLRIFPGRMGITYEFQGSETFGMILRKRREALGLTVRQVSNASNVPHTTVARIERGEFSAPRPDKLARVAAALELSPVELFAQAGYFSPDALPDFATYLSAKYPDLSALAVASYSSNSKS